MPRWLGTKARLFLTALAALSVLGSVVVGMARTDTAASQAAYASTTADSLGSVTPGNPAEAGGPGGGGLATHARRAGLAQLYRQGGVFMHPLLLCALIALVLCIERAWALSHARSDTKRLMIDVVRALREEGPDAALAVCQRTRGPIAAVLHSGLLRAHRGAEAVEKAIATSGAIEMAFLERGLTLLASLSNVAPLLGFLGTVSGMISAFSAITAADHVSAGLVAAGVEEALISTAAGLMIAVAVTVFYGFFVMAIDRFIIEMEEASTELVDELLDIEYKRGSMA